jgi:hypothetical protein
MERRYQVFVSSTYGDLREERQEVMQALLELDCIPAGMELFPAADEDQWTLIQRVIDDCDYYIVIIAGRYGSIGPSGKSYTQMEYEYAVSEKKPVIAFLHGEPGKIQADRTDPENREKLEEFRRVARQKMCKHWHTPQELGSVVSRSIVRLMKDKQKPRNAPCFPNLAMSKECATALASTAAGTRGAPLGCIGNPCRLGTCPARCPRFPDTVAARRVTRGTYRPRTSSGAGRFGGAGEIVGPYFASWACHT